MENIVMEYASILLLSMIPFFEVFVTIPMGIIVFDFPPVIVLMVTFVGNLSSVLFFMFFGGQINYFIYLIHARFNKKGYKQKDMSPLMKRTLERFGVKGVCFLSSLLFSSQIGSGAMMTLGAQRRHVFIWTNLGVGSLAIMMTILSVMAEEFVLRLVDV